MVIEYFSIKEMHYFIITWLPQGFLPMCSRCFTVLSREKTEREADHVYFEHPSTIYRSTYRLIVDRCIGRYIGVNRNKTIDKGFSGLGTHIGLVPFVVLFSIFRFQYLYLLVCKPMASFDLPVETKIGSSSRSAGMFG